MAKRYRTNNDLQNTTQKDRQYNGQKIQDKQWSTKHYTEGQTIQWPKDTGQTMIYKTLHRRTDNTMAKRYRTNNDLQNTTQKDRQYNGQKIQDKQWSTKHYTEGQTMQWPKDTGQTMIYKTLHRRIDNTMAKKYRTNNDLQNTTQKDRQYNGQKIQDKQWSTKHYTEGQTIQWPKDTGQTMIYKTLHRRTDNTMAKRYRTNNDLQNTTQKDRQYNGQKIQDKQWSTKHYTEGQTIQWPKETGQTMIYKTLHRRTDNTMAKRYRTNNDLQNTTQKDRQYNGQKIQDKQWSTKHYTEGQTIQWPKDTGQTMIYKTLHRRTDNTMAKRYRTNNDLQNTTQKDRQYNEIQDKQWSTKHYTEGQTIQWPKDTGQTMIYKTLHRRTDNTMAKRYRTNNDLQNITQKDRQYNGQTRQDKQWSTKHYTEGQTIQWPKDTGQTMIYKTLHRRTDNTMAKRYRTNNDLQNTTQKDRQYNGQKIQDKQWSTKHYTEGQTIQWPKDTGQTMIYKTLHRRTDNTMAKRYRTNNDLQNTTQKDRQYNGQKIQDKQWSTKHYIEGQTIQWPNETGQTMIYKTLHRRTDNTMAKRYRTNNDLQNTTQKDRQYNGQKIQDKQWSTKHYTEG